MVYTQHYCAKCGSEQIRRNGHSGGRAKYQCKVCRYQGYFQPAAVEKARQYAQVDQLLLERNSLRSIVRATGVARNTIAKRVKKSGDTGAPITSSAPEKSAEEALGGT